MNKTNRDLYNEFNFFFLQICPLRKGKYKEKSTEVRQAALQQNNLCILKKKNKAKNTFSLQTTDLHIPCFVCDKGHTWVLPEVSFAAYIQCAIFKQL